MPFGAMRRIAAALAHITASVGGKLYLLMFAVLVINLGVLGYSNVELQRRHLEAAKLDSAQRVSDVIRRSTSYYMLKHDPEAIANVVDTLGKEPEILRLRIFNSTGRVGFSTEKSEVGSQLNLGNGGMPVEQQSTVVNTDGHRSIKIRTPLRNSATCSTAACHAHPSSESFVGGLDINMSLAREERSVAAVLRRYVVSSFLVIVLTLVATAVFVFLFVQRPVSAVRAATEKIREGDLGVQISTNSNDEFGVVADSFNQMSAQLEEAQAAVTTMTQSLEERVQQKTIELQRAQDQMIHAEKLTSLGKLAAVVAHEINNPLSGILTYAKLLRKWVDRGDGLEKHTEEMHDALQLIESESRRCGDLVRNLLTFARVAPMNITDVDINAVIRQCLMLVDHKMELGNISPHLELEERLPKIKGDAGQLEQLILALVMNAIDAMPREGNLRLTTSLSENQQDVVITVEDDGTGIPESVLPRLFDPFVTTKEDGKGVGLGLAISRSIVERHSGVISVQSELGKGTAFTIKLPATVIPESAVITKAPSEVFA